MVAGKEQFKVVSATAKGEIETVIAPKGGGGSGESIDCHVDISGSNGVSNGVSQTFALSAMACRRVNIQNITATPMPPPEPPKVEEKPTTIDIDVKPIEPQPTVSVSEKLKKGLSKKVLRALLSECDYFEMIREQDPMIYDGIKSRIKNFNPIFHSITPEGLNARLTFLQQCMRPGDTIPTAVETGQGGTSLVYNDVTNSAFGSPPICILRIGDFYHTKVVFESLDISYENAVYDLNPEGIGVQPMIASISMNVKFIGGHGLKEPVAQLQNALSFNY